MKVFSVLSNLKSLVYLRLLKYLLPHRRALAGAIVCMIFSGLMYSAPPFIVKMVLDDLFIAQKWSLVGPLVVVMISIYTLRGLLYFGHFYLMAFVGQNVIRRLRDDLFAHFQSLPLQYFLKTPTGVVMSRITNDVNLIQGAVTKALASLLMDTVRVLGLVAYCFWQDWLLSLVAFTVFPVAVALIVHFGRRIRKLSQRGQIYMGSLNSILYEVISGIRIVKAFGMEAHEARKFEAENQRMFKNTMRHHKVRAISTPLMELLGGGIGASGVVWYGVYLVKTGQSTPGTFLSFLTAVLLLYDPLKKLSKMNNTIQEGLAASERVFEVLDSPKEPGAGDELPPLPPITESIEYRDVSFKYEDDLVLKGISLRVKAGETVALVGPSGGGKTTMLNLLPRFYDVTSGGVYIDGHDIREYSLASLRGQMALVTQHTILFNDTIAGNISYGRPSCTQAQIEEAARAANAHDFIMETPDGYQTLIGESGIRLSGGQRQRIAIARAILKDAPILILDEATSSLDTESELEVQKALEFLMRGRTTFVIAHRLSTVRNAERILVIVDGRIEEAGAHQELLRSGGEYRKLYGLQFREDRSAAD